jgi:uncharacterized membrane protein YfcA
VSLIPVLAVALAGAAAGVLGALLGLGGGVLLVPFLVTVLEMPFAHARGISLMTVVATSCAVTASSRGGNLVNVRLAMLLQVATAAGGLTGGLTSRLFSGRTLEIVFACVMLFIAAVILSRLNTRAIGAGTTVDAGRFGGRMFDPELGRHVIYRVQRIPLALVVSFVGGNVSSLLGIGGGVLMVPALNAWCGIPMRVSAATSAFMIGVTAISALPIYWARGQITPDLAAGAVLGVIAGSRAGFVLVTRVHIRWLKLLMIAVLVTVATLMFGKGKW